MRHRCNWAVASVGVAIALACASCASAPARAPGVIPPVTGEPRALAGIRVVDLAEGTGAAYAPRRCIYTHYTGWLEDGTRFDSSRDAHAPADHPSRWRHVQRGRASASVVVLSPSLRSRVNFAKDLHFAGRDVQVPRFSGTTKVVIRCRA